ncbi:unnamed protein product [Hydatigera taeniaeformis]|uniref:Uncharacterized protein n=1 Tax=Hydatigena taeniaeformis TaxID=6205 RepID=A0A0R3WNJ8_HYDTA|nr:unnamed protein product [Hydatigera taeniaeformis]
MLVGCGAPSGSRPEVLLITRPGDHPIGRALEIPKETFESISTLYQVTFGSTAEWWKRKSFKRSNGYDAADVVDHTPPTCPEQIKLLPLSQETPSLHQDTPPPTTTGHESRSTSEENAEGTSVIITTPPAAPTTTVTDSRDLEAGIRKSITPLDHVDGDVEAVVEEAEEEEDIDKVVALVTRPRSGASGGSLLRVQKSVVQEAGVSGKELSTLGFINRSDYWEHSAFGRSRITAIVLAFVAVCCLLYCLVATTWAYSGPRKYNSYLIC